MLEAFCEMTGVEPAQVLMVGDSLHDMVAGRAAGMRNIAVLTGVATRPQLDPFAYSVIPSIAALPKLLSDMAVEQAAA